MITLLEMCRAQIARITDCLARRRANLSVQEELQLEHDLRYQMQREELLVGAVEFEEVFGVAVEQAA